MPIGEPSAGIPGRYGNPEMDALLDQLSSAQATLGQTQKFGGRVNPGGVVAASSPLDTGFGFGYFPNLHVGATSWYLMALLKTNPYRFV